MNKIFESKKLMVADSEYQVEMLKLFWQEPHLFNTNKFY